MFLPTKPQLLKQKIPSNTAAWQGHEGLGEKTKFGEEITLAMKLTDAVGSSLIKKVSRRITLFAATSVILKVYLASNTHVNSDAKNRKSYWKDA